MKYVIHKPSIKRSKFCLSHCIKLGLTKNFVKALDLKGPAFTYLCGKFPRLTYTKLKAGVCIGPQIKYLFKDQQFESALSDKEKESWQSFEKFSNGFLGNFKPANFRALLQDLMYSYEQLGCNMSLKMHFLFSHLNFFPLNCGAVSDEHRALPSRRFVDGARYRGKWSPALLRDYYWFMKRDAPEIKYHRQVKRTHR